MPSKSPEASSKAAARPHFHFHGCGHAFSAQFTRPFTEHIDALAASALPPTGGHGSALVENFQFRRFISFDRAYTHVSGGYQEDDNSNNTLVTSVIEGLNMFDVLTADRVVSRLYSKHPDGDPEGKVTMHGSRFDNLAICGEEVKLNLDFKLFEDIKTFADATKAVKGKGKFAKVAKNPLLSGKAVDLPDSNGSILCSLVENGSLQVDYPGATTSGHSVHIPGFGTVYFAEVFMSHGTRTLTMLRFKLGSATKGDGSGASSTSNGRTYPPG